MKASTNSNLKIIAFFLAIVGISFFIHKQKEKGGFKDKVNLLHATSENAKGIYTGKVRAVYNPLDQSYKVSDGLKSKLKQYIDPSSLGSWPIISLWIEPEDLTGENRGIIHPDNTFKRGRLWERATLFRYYSDGELQFESMAGLRQHGNASRRVRNKIKNFRIYFRGKYGEKEFKLKEDITLSKSGSIKTVVLRNEVGINFSNDITGLLINELGGISPKFSHVALFINGEFYSFYHMSQRLSDKSVAELLGHDNFVYAKMYSDKTIRDRVLYNKLRTQIETPSSLTYEYVANLIDMDSIMVSLLVAMYVGNGDWGQGTYIKDLNKNIWKHISWDFDVSFVPSYHNHDYKKGVENSWDIRSLYIGLDQKKENPPWYLKIRFLVFSKLIYKDKKFRKYFSDLVDRLFLEVIPSKALKDRFRLYNELANDSRDIKLQARLKDLEAFFKNRQDVFCAKLAQRVELIPKSCQVE